MIVEAQKVLLDMHLPAGARRGEKTYGESED
jgi:hypothetical protein